MVSAMLPFIVTPNSTMAATINTIAVAICMVSLDIILPPTTVATLVGVMNSRASSPRSRSPASDSPIPIMAPIIIVMTSTAGTKKSMYLMSP